MAELWLLISAPSICPRSNSSISPTPSPLKMCDLDSILLAEHYWLPANCSTVCPDKPAPVGATPAMQSHRRARRTTRRKRYGPASAWGHYEPDAAEIEKLALPIRAG